MAALNASTSRDRYDKPGLFIQHRLNRSSRLCSDNRNSRRLCLKWNSRKAFAVGRQYAYIHQAIKRRHIGDESCTNHGRVAFDGVPNILRNRVARFKVSHQQ